MQAEQVTEPAQQRLEFVEHRDEFADLTDVGERCLAAVEGSGQRLVVTGCAPGQNGPAAVVDRHVERQRVGGDDGEPGEQIRLHRAVADRRRNAQPTVNVRGGVGARAAEGNRRIAAERAQGHHLQTLVADRVGGGHGALQVGHRLLVIRSRLIGAAADDQCPAANLQIADPLSGVEPAGDQLSGIVGGRPAQGLLTGQQPGARGPWPVLGGRRVHRHRLRAPGQQVDRPAVVGQARRRRCGRVEHFTDQVVRELVVAARDDEQPGRQRVLAAGHHGGKRLGQQVGHDVRLEGHAEHGRGTQQLIHRPSRPPDPGEHRGFERGRHAGIAGRQRAQRLDDEQRMPARLPQDPLGEIGLSGGRGEARHRRGGQRPEFDPLGDAAQLVEHLRALLGAHRCDDQQPAASRLPDEEVHEFDGRAAGVLQIVQAHQHRTALGERPHERRHRLERQAPFEFGVAPLDATIVAEHRGDLGHQAGEVGRAVAGEVAQHGGRQAAHCARDRLDDRLQEQRLLGLVAPRAEHRPARRRRDPHQLLAQAGLADARLADHHDQLRVSVRRLVPGLAQPLQLLRPADQPERLGGTVERCGPHRRGGIVVAQQREVDRLRFGRRVGAEFSGKTLAQFGVRRERTPVLAGGAVCLHERTARRLVVGIRNGGRLGGRSRQAMVTRREGRVRERQPRPGYELGQLAPRRLSPGGIRFVFERLARDRDVMPTPGGGQSQRGLAGREPAFGFVQVSGRLVQIDQHFAVVGQPVSLPAATDRARSEGFAQAADEGRNVLGRTLGRFRSPQRVDDPVDRNEVGPFDSQQLEQQPGLAAAQIHSGHRAVIAGDPERPDEFDAHHGVRHRTSPRAPHRTRPVDASPGGTGTSCSIRGRSGDP